MDDAPTLSAREIARLSTEEIFELAAETSQRMAALAGLVVLLTGELDRREGWRADGATSVEDWLVERTGVSMPTARTYSHVGERLFDLPHLASGLSSGALSLDKVRAVADVATPETDREIADAAATLSVKDLAQLARSRKKPTSHGDAADQENRSLRFNDTFRTITAQLPPASYVEAKNRLYALAQKGDGETTLDQRLADAFMELVRQSGRRVKATASSDALLVAHVPLDVLLNDRSTLCGELERGGFISGDVIRRMACDSTLIVAADDDAGHTMYEGRQHRLATPTQRREIWRRDRHCRFPGCDNGIFCLPHHIRRWKPDRGPTDLPNLILLCEYHHHLIHSNAWKMSGDANAVVTFEGPTGRAMTSEPSIFWTHVGQGPLDHQS
jgi:hypothetical protein